MEQVEHTHTVDTSHEDMVVSTRSGITMQNLLCRNTVSVIPSFPDICHPFCSNSVDVITYSPRVFGWCYLVSHVIIS